MAQFFVSKHLPMPVFFWSLFGYVFTGGVQFGFAVEGVIGFAVPVTYVSCGIAFHAILYWIFASGFNERFRDPRMASLERWYGFLTQLVFLAWAPAIGYMFLMNLFLVFQFSAINGDRKVFLRALLITVLWVGAVLLFIGKPVGVPQATPLQRILVVMSFFLAVSRTGMLSVIMVGLRAALARKHKQQTQTMAQLNETLERLQRTQDELVRSEKMAALGRLVAGVAQELNTPIGNATLVASSLRDETRKMLSDVEQGKVQRSAFLAYCRHAEQSSELLQRNLENASRLIGSFKQVAVDQTSDAYRSYDLQTCIDQVLRSLSPMYRNSPFTLDVRLAPGIVMQGYPGAVGQIVTNLVSNALTHAFVGRSQGAMYLETVPLGDDRVKIVFQDNGVGIPLAHQARVFDPFFTTTLGRGGSGLGMHIVYNLVTGLLRGSIELESKVGEGTSFVIRLPRVTPPGDGPSPAPLPG